MSGLEVRGQKIPKPVNKKTQWPMKFQDFNDNADTSNKRKTKQTKGASKRRCLAISSQF